MFVKNTYPPLGFRTIRVSIKNPNKNLTIYLHLKQCDDSLFSFYYIVATLDALRCSWILVRIQ